jgi:hypothetical protein
MTQREYLDGCRDSKEARRRAPWAAFVRRVDGGYMAFPTVDDYAMWKNQK